MSIVSTISQASATSIQVAAALVLNADINNLDYDKVY